MHLTHFRPPCLIFLTILQGFQHLIFGHSVENADIRLKRLVSALFSNTLPVSFLRIPADEPQEEQGDAFSQRVMVLLFCLSFFRRYHQKPLVVPCPAPAGGQGKKLVFPEKNIF